MLKKYEYTVELVIALLLFVLISVFSYVLQAPISVNHGHGFDGVVYFNVAEQFANQSLPAAPAPFVYRIGTPLLASLFFKSDLLLGFKIINIVGSLLASVLLVFWLRLYLNNRNVRILLAAFFLVMWHGPTRFVHYYPVYSDPLLFVALLAGLIGIKKAQENATVARICLLGLIVFVGVIFREVTLVIAVAFLFSANPIILSGEISYALANFQLKRVIKSVPLIFFLPLGLGVLGLLLVCLVATQSNSYSPIEEAISWAYKKPLLTYLHAWFIAFGPIIVVPIYYWREATRFLVENQFMLVYLLGFAVLAWIGGSDTERILFWSMPVTYLLIGKSIEDNSILAKALPIELAILCAVQLISERAFWIIPDFPNSNPTPLPLLTVLGNNFQYFDLYSYFGSPVVREVSLLEYALLGALLLWWLNYRAVKPRGMGANGLPG
jgi:hypothetical protein